MPGPVPKAPGLRQRRNRVSSRATLPSTEDSAKNKVPPLPERELKTEKWHPKVREWWAAVWRSPMAAEYLDADTQGGLYLLAELHQRRWTAKDTKELIEVVGKILQAQKDFGLTPMDRRRLQWEVEKGDQASERTAKRRQHKQASSKDPRDALRIA